jgi:hypothetical protein
LDASDSGTQEPPMSSVLTFKKGIVVLFFIVKEVNISREGCEKHMLQKLPYYCFLITT